MSEVRNCIKELSATGIKAPGRRVGIEVRDDVSVFDLRICTACTTVGRFAMEQITSDNGHSTLVYSAEKPAIGATCQVELATRRTAAENMKKLLAAVAAREAEIATGHAGALYLDAPVGAMEVTAMPNLSRYLSLEALAAMVGSQQPQPGQLLAQ